MASLGPILYLYRHSVLSFKFYGPQIAHRVLLNILRLLQNLFEMRLSLRRVEPIFLPIRIARHILRHLILISLIITTSSPQGANYSTSLLLAYLLPLSYRALEPG